MWVSARASHATFLHPRTYPLQPGIAYGTLPHRIDATLLRFLPRRAFEQQ